VATCKTNYLCARL